MNDNLKERYEKWLDDIGFNCYDAGLGFNCSVLEELCEFIKELTQEIQSSGEVKTE